MECDERLHTTQQPVECDKSLPTIQLLIEAIESRLSEENSYTPERISQIADAIADAHTHNNPPDGRFEAYSFIGVPEQYQHTLNVLEEALLNIHGLTDIPETASVTMPRPRRIQEKTVSEACKNTNVDVIKRDALVIFFSDRHAYSQLTCNDGTLQVIGSGFNGLAMAACLQNERLSVAVIEKESQVGNVWRKRYERLHIHNLTQVNALPYLPFPENSPAYLSKVPPSCSCHCSILLTAVC